MPKGVESSAAVKTPDEALGIGVHRQSLRRGERRAPQIPQPNVKCISLRSFFEGVKELGERKQPDQRPGA
jgi:hypothetical protein